MSIECKPIILLDYKDVPLPIAFLFCAVQGKKNLLCLQLVQILTITSIIFLFYILLPCLYYQILSKEVLFSMGAQNSVFIWTTFDIWLMY